VKKAIFFSSYQFLTRPVSFSSKNTHCLDYIIRNKLLGIFGLYNLKYVLPRFLKETVVYIISMT